MARLRRFVAINQPHLVEQRAMEDTLLFRQSDDQLRFLELLKESAKVNRATIHGYSLLPGKIFILATPTEANSLSGLMQWIGRRYVPLYNARYERSGPLWRARYRASPVDSSTYFLTACQYIDEAAVRDGLGAQPSDFQWSSYHHYTGARHDPLLTAHTAYWQLGNTPFAREAAYRGLFDQPLSAAKNAMIDSALRGGWAIGSSDFAASLEPEAGRRLTPGAPGRPPGKRRRTDQDDMSPINSSDAGGATK